MKWFEEQLEVKDGRIMKIGYTNKIASMKSEFQQIDVYQTQAFGRMLVLDDVIMVTEFDEANYHEMIVHVPMTIHPDPRSVLVIGGGDGGTLREVLKHESVKRADLCEIDPGVVEVSKKHLPGLAESFDDERVTVFYEDGAAFVKKHKDTYDLILVDSSDPIGPAEVLFQEAFYRDMYNALTVDGIVATQSESFHYHRSIIRKIAEFSRRIFPVYEYYYTMVPTYPSGVIGFSFCSKSRHPLKDFNAFRAKHLSALKYYNPAIHRAAFNLPEQFRKSLQGL